MRDLLIDVQPLARISRQSQIRERIVTAILAGQLPPGERMPSSRQLAKDIGVSRNTVTLAYQALLDEGYLVARERSGYFISETVLEDFAASAPQDPPTDVIDWASRLRIQPTLQTNISKPQDWHSYKYPFIYGQVDHTLFPIAGWRDCSRQALGRKWLDAWTADMQANDDDLLIEQIKTRLLPRRGIVAQDNEIMITMGAQQALYILASLLVQRETTVAIENPGYPDVRNIFGLRTERLIMCPVDEQGMVVDQRTAAADIICTTPSHQAPTTVTMSSERRGELLDIAALHDSVIIEDDYEFETNYVRSPLPALKSRDRTGRVIYVGSLSKVLFPGLRLGYIVAPAPLIDEARALRRLMVRHPPANNQRTAALFLALGYHDGLISKLRRVYGERWKILLDALDMNLPRCEIAPSTGGTSVWLNAPPGCCTRQLAERCRDREVLIEPGDIYHAAAPTPRNTFRLGFSSIPTDRIEDGVKLIASLI